MRLTEIGRCCLILFSVSVAGTPALAGAATYANPVIDEIGPADPDVILHNGTY